MVTRQVFEILLKKHNFCADYCNKFIDDSIILQIFMRKRNRLLWSMYGSYFIAKSSSKLIWQENLSVSLDSRIIRQFQSTHQKRKIFIIKTVGKLPIVYVQRQKILCFAHKSKDSLVWLHSILVSYVVSIWVNIKIRVMLKID